MKPVFAIDVSDGAPSPLASHLLLAHTADDGCFHTAHGLRLPLGIYNVSVSRVCDKVTRLCQRLETYFNASGTLDPQHENDEVMQELIDYVELSLYAAAEHVDDIDSIASGFYRSTALRDKHPTYRALAKAIKQHKRFVASAANAIKHQQSRIRVFSMEYMHGPEKGTLHGYFIEGVEHGVICPSGTFHKGQDVFSITTLAWEILLFLLLASQDLAAFLQVMAKQHEGPMRTEFNQFSAAVIGAARLPLYTFGEEHPFSRATFRIFSSAKPMKPLDSALYGSIRKGWSRNAGFSFGQSASRFVGDGKSTQFRFAQPKTLSLHHWD